MPKKDKIKVKKTEIEDFTIDYPQAEEGWGYSRRWFQDLIQKGILSKKDQDNKTYLSQSELNQITPKTGHRPEEAPEQELAKYKGGMGVLAPYFQKMEQKLEQKEEIIAELSQDNGKLEAERNLAVKEADKLKGIEADLAKEVEKRMQDEVRHIRKLTRTQVTIIGWAAVAMLLIFILTYFDIIPPPQEIARSISNR